MSETGVVFDIEQLAVFDGPGIRTTIFFKGCPLRCQWCHNPEGLRYMPQLMVSRASCTKCGNCSAVCKQPNHCTLCGKCLTVCPLGLRRIAGKGYTAEELATQLLKDATYLAAGQGGYTLSGGEPTAQPAFMLELLQRLHGNHRAIETSGFCSTPVFASLLQNIDFVMLDLKLIDPAQHKQFTGVSNQPILKNLEQLKASDLPFVVRIPLIPTVNDSAANLRATATLLKGCKNLQGVELLPYHKTAGAKYTMVGMEYSPSFDRDAIPNPDTSIFLEQNIPCTIL